MDQHRHHGNEQRPLSDSSSEESSSDSDYGSSNHYDVSRTVSLEKSESSELEKGRLEFGLKLGYRLEQVESALNKLGPSTSTNELLAELIQSDANSSPGGQRRRQQQDTVTTATDPPPPLNNTIKQLHHIILDGSNIAMTHGLNKVFSCSGIKLAVDYFKQRGHREITVFVPNYRKCNGNQGGAGGGEEVRDPQLLPQLESAGHLVFTPSRETSTGRRLVCYDDRYILKLALQTGGVVVSNDNYRDLVLECPDYKHIIETRLLMYSFVGDLFMPPDDPLGRGGPNLDQFLCKSSGGSLGGRPPPPPCPYGRKCTYGSKCKYYHSQPSISVTEVLRKQAAVSTQSLPIATSRQQQQLNLHGNGAPQQQQSKLHRVKSADYSNAHRKLRRELSVNPNGDERVLVAMATQQQQQQQTLSALSRQPQQQQQQEYLPAFPTQPHLSRVWGPPISGGDSALPSQPQQQQQQQLSSSSSPSQQQQIHASLSAIFPPQQVTHVMSLYPNETNPQILCRHIVSMFN